MQHRKFMIGGAAAVAALGLYALVGFYWVPHLVRTQVLELFAREYDRQAEIGEVRFNPFTFEFEAREFGVPDNDGERLLGFGRLYVNFELSSAVHRAWTFQDIDLERPYLRVVQLADGRINLADLAPPEKAASEQPAEAGGIPALRIGRFVVDEGTVDVLDRTRSEPFATTLTPVSFELDDFRTAGAGNHFAFEAGSDRAGRLAVEGNLGVEPLASQGKLALTGLQATTISDYLGSVLPVEISSGLVDLGLTYDFSLAGEPFTLAVDMPLATVRDLSTVARGHELAWRVPEIDIRDTRVDIAARTVRVGQVEVRDAATPVWIDADGFHAPGAVPRAGTGAPETAAPGDAAGSADNEDTTGTWRIEVPDVAILNTQVDFEDRQMSPATTLELTVSEFRLKGFALPAQAPLEVSALVVSGAGGEVSTTGTVSLDPLTVGLDVAISKLDLRPAQPYVNQATDMSLDSGSLTAEGRLDYASGTKPVLRFAGDLTVEELATRDRAVEEDFINWKTLSVEGISYTSAPARLDVRQVTATRPYLRLILAENGVTNIQSVLDPEGAERKARELEAERQAREDSKARSARKTKESGATPTATPKAAPTEPGLPMSIGVVRIVDGALKFTDYTLRPRFEIAMEAMNGRIDKLSSRADARASVDLKGQVDRYAPASITGELNVLSVDTYIDLAASFRNIELTTFDPYSGKFAGYHIDKGKLTIETQYKVENRQLDARHKFIVNQLELGEKVDSPDAVSLPLKLAVALLKDSNGVIDLDLPISGSIDDPKFKVGPIIWKAFVGLMTKIVTAPFALLGSLFGGGEDLSYVDFAAGSATLDDAAQEKLMTLKKALAERPALSLDVPSPFAPEADRAALAEARWVAAVSAAGQSPGTPEASWQADRKEYLRRLEILYREQSGTRPDVPKPPRPADGEAPIDPVEHAIAFLEPTVRSAVTVTDEEVAALGPARAEAVRDALLGDGSIDPARLFIISGEAPAPGDGSIRMSLSLK